MSVILSRGRPQARDRLAFARYHHLTPEIILRCRVTGLFFFRYLSVLSIDALNQLDLSHRYVQ